MAEDDLPPIVDLNAFRKGRSQVVKPTLKIRARNGKLHLQTTVPCPEGFSISLGIKAVETLLQQCQDFLYRERRGKSRDEHRCGRCNLVVGIECRGHYSKRMHHQREVLERGGYWLSQGGVGSEPVWVDSVQLAHTACGRKDRRTDTDWSKVTCAACLKRRLRAVD